MDELEIRSRINFLKVDGVLPSFANVTEFPSIDHLQYDVRFRKKKIGISERSLFLFFGEMPVRESSAPFKKGKNPWVLSVFVRLLRAVLGGDTFERFGKRIWMSTINHMSESSKIRAFFIKLGQHNKEISSQRVSFFITKRSQTRKSFRLLGLIKNTFNRTYSKRDLR